MRAQLLTDSVTRRASLVLVHKKLSLFAPRLVHFQSVAGFCGAQVPMRFPDAGPLMESSLPSPCENECFAPVCPFQIGYDMGFTSAMCEGSNFLFNGDPGLIA